MSDPATEAAEDLPPETPSTEAGGPGARGGRRRLLGRLRLIRETRRGTAYDAFISYSHAADGRLAPAIQKGLQRFAKPWYRMRALHVFRDDDILSANPDLWESVEEALNASRYFILLASPRAAASRWVDQEAAYWREHRSTNQLLIGLTEGELVWDEAGAQVDWERTTALPRSLEGAFAREPRYIDLRWARRDDDLALTHPRWREMVAELAAPLHGVPKDELAGEEVRQHRRTVRVVRAAVAVLGTALAAAVVLGLIAYSQSRTATARALAAEATADLTTNPEHSLDLALRSTRINASSTDLQALRLALAQAPERMAISSGVSGARARAAWNPAAEQLAMSGPNGTVSLWDARTGHLEHVLTGGGSSTSQLAFSPDGRWLAEAGGDGRVEVWNVGSATSVSTEALNGDVRRAYTLTGDAGPYSPFISLSWRLTGPDELLVSGATVQRLLSFEPATSTVSDLVPLKHPNFGVSIASYSPDASRLLFSYASSTFGSTSSILDIAQRSSTAVRAHADLQGHEACWIADGKVFVTWDPTEAQDQNLRWFDAQTGAEIASIPFGVTAAACSRSPTQDWVTVGDRSGHVLLRLTNGTTFSLAGHSRLVTSIASSADGDYVATASDDGTARIWDTRTGAELRVLRDGDAITHVEFSPDDGLALTIDQRGIARVWDSGIGEPLIKLQHPSAGQPYPLGFVNHGAEIFGLDVTFVSRPSTPSASPTSAPLNTSLLFWRVANGQLSRQVPLPDIGAATVPCTLSTNNDECALTPPPSLAIHIPAAEFTHRLVSATISPDGSTIAYSEANGVGLMEASGRPLAGLALGQRPTGVSFSSSGQLLAMTPQGVYVWRPRSSVPARSLAQPSAPVDAEFSADGARVATADTGGAVTIWNAQTGTRIATFHATSAFVAQVHKLQGGTITDKVPLPVRVALNGDGSEVAVGTTWETVLIWNVDQHRLVAARLVSSPLESGASTEGFDGPWSIAELRFSADSSALVAVDFPIYGAGDSKVPVTAQVFTSAGALVASYQSPDVNPGALDPGAVLDPLGQNLLAGAIGVAPESSNGNDAVYQNSTGAQLLNLQSATLAPPAEYSDAPPPAEPWAPNGVDVLAGDGGVYACDACGSTAQLQRAAETRLAWLKALSINDPTAPPGNPFG